MQLSPHFTLEALCKSDYALRVGIDNTTNDPAIIDNLRRICERILEPVREHYGAAFEPNSGYRCLTLNRAIGSPDNSQHVKGEAADIEVPGIANYELALWISRSLEFDQLILEFYTPGVPASGWVHVSLAAANNRRETLTINKRQRLRGLVR